jgi:hypothetical protein
VTTDLIATYRELARLQTQLTEDVTRYRNEIHALLQVLFPEYSQVFADPCRPTALGQVKLSKRGSGRIRRILYMAVVRCIRLKDSAFGAYYHHLVARGRPRRAAMMAVMRKMLMVAYRLLKTKEAYDPTKVFAQAVVQAPALEPQPGQPHLAHAGA